MDFYKLLMIDDVAIDYLMKSPEIIKFVTFYGRAEAYNYQHGYLNEKSPRSMDHRRLIDDYFKFSSLLFKRRLPEGVVFHESLLLDRVAGICR